MADLVARGVSKSFGGVQALDGVDFAADAGEVHALLGENGAGKSTFIKILTGAVAPDEGALTLFGKPLARRQPARGARAGIAAVFQELSLVPDLTVAENIWFRHEPLSPLAHRPRPQASAGDARASSSDSPSRPSTRRREVRRLTRRRAAARRDREGGRLGASRAHPRRGDLGAGAARDRMAARARPAGSPATGKLVIYISHRLGEVRNVADRSPSSATARPSRTRSAAEATEDEIIVEMLGRRLERLYPEKGQSAGEDVALRVRGLPSGQRLRDVDLDAPRGRGARRRRACRARASSSSSSRSSASSARSGHGRGLGQAASRIASPRQALNGRDRARARAGGPPRQGLLLAEERAREPDALGHAPLLALRHPRPRAGARARRRSDAALHIMPRAPEQPAGDASPGGNQQKVMFGKLLLTEARVLLLYDPTRGVDVGTKGEIFQLMRELADKGYAILFFSTDLPELVHVADRVAVLRTGRSRPARRERAHRGRDPARGDRARERRRDSRRAPRQLDDRRRTGDRGGDRRRPLRPPPCRPGAQGRADPRALRDAPRARR